METLPNGALVTPIQYQWRNPNEYYANTLKCDDLTTAKQNTTKPSTYLMGHAVYLFMWSHPPFHNYFSLAASSPNNVC